MRRKRQRNRLKIIALQELSQVKLLARNNCGASTHLCPPLVSSVYSILVNQQTNGHANQNRIEIISQSFFF